MLSRRKVFATVLIVVGLGAGPIQSQEVSQTQIAGSPPAATDVEQCASLTTPQIEGFAQDAIRNLEQQVDWNSFYYKNFYVHEPSEQEQLAKVLINFRYLVIGALEVHIMSERNLSPLQVFEETAFNETKKLIMNMPSERLMSCFPQIKSLMRLTAEHWQEEQRRRKSK
jgi:hypothetical protein